MDNLSLEERLNDQINKKDHKIEKLKSKIEQLEFDKDLSRLSWQQHTVFLNDSFSKQMPYPRLEMRLQRVSTNNWYYIEWIYGLVYKHFGEMDSNYLLFIPFSKTENRGGDGSFESHFHKKQLELPFRDGVHIKAEANLLNLPAYITCKEKNIVQKIDLSDFDFEQYRECLTKS